MMPFEGARGNDPGLPPPRVDMLAASNAIDTQIRRRREYTLRERLGSLAGAVVIALLTWAVLVMLP